MNCKWQAKGYYYVIYRFTVFEKNMSVYPGQVEILASQVLFSSSLPMGKGQAKESSNCILYINYFNEPKRGIALLKHNLRR